MTTRITGEHVFHTPTAKEQPAARRYGVSIGNGRYWFTASNWNRFVIECQQAESRDSNG
jgi:hypothetical protein